MRVVAIGDVGVERDMIHLGDEAMLAELVIQLRRRGIDDITVVSANPADTAERYDVEATPRIDFDAPRAATVRQREARMEGVLRAARGETGRISWQDPAWRVIEAIAAADAVIIAGGGNLTSLWPAHVYERATIGELADIFGKPLVVTGQTVGPALLGRDGELIARLLNGATLVGVREAASRALVARLGVDDDRVRQTIDDASFLGIGEAVPDELPAGPYCLVTFAADTGSAYRDAFVEVAAAFVDHVSAATGAEVILLSHAASIEAGVLAGDAELHALILDRTTAERVSARSTESAVLSAELARHAELSISTRYHPSVFAASVGVPAIGIGIDGYTDSKIAGALGNFGQLDQLVPPPALFTGDAALVVDEVWKHRKAIRDSGSSVATTRSAEAALWWDDVAAALRGEPVTRYGWQPIPSTPRLAPALRARLDGLRRWMLAESRRTTDTAIAVRGLQEHRDDLLQTMVDAEAAAGAAHAEAETALARAADAEAALASAHDLQAVIADPLFARKLSREPGIPQTTEVLALMDTRLFRWTTVPRDIYGRLLRAAQRRRAN